MAQSEEQKLAQTIFDTFFGGGEQLFDPTGLANLQQGILDLIDQGLNEEQILAVLEEQNPSVPEARKARAKEAVLRAAGDLTLPGGGGTAPTLDSEITDTDTDSSRFFGEAPLFDNAGNVWTQSVDQIEGGVEWQRNGQPVDISDPAMRASLQEAQANAGRSPVTGRAPDPLGDENQRLVNEGLQRELDRNPNLQLITDEFGESFIFDIQKNTKTSIGKTGFSKLDPARKFNEDIRQFDAKFGEDSRQFDANFGLDTAVEDRLRRRLGVDVGTTNQAAAFGRFDRLTEILRNPSDFLSRAFLQRGVNSPTGSQITQADLINALRTEIPDVASPEFKIGIDELTAQFGGGQPAAAPAADVDTLSTDSPQDSAPSTRGGGFGATVPFGSTNQVAPTGAKIDFINPNLSQDQIDAFYAGLVTNTPTPAITPDPTPPPAAPVPEANRATGITDEETRFNMGGTTQESRFLVGDSRGGAVNSTTEMVLNPTNAPLSVVPNSALGQTNGVTRFGLGTFSSADNQITQDEIVDMVQKFSPPAVSSLFDQTKIPGQRFGFDLFTPQQSNQLTDDETEALRTRLGAEFNTTLEDVTKAQKTRFGRTRQRGRGRLLV